MSHGLRDIAACGAQEQVIAQIDGQVEEQARATRAVAGLAAAQTASVGLGGLLPVAVVILLAGWLDRRGMTPGVILGALTYLLQGLQPALQTFVRGIGGTGVWLSTVVGRVLETAPADAVGLDDQVTAPPVSAPDTRRDGRSARPAVRLRDVTFRYGSHAEPVFAGLRLRMAPGDDLVVVGPSGAGKSTFAAVLAGVLVPSAGEVTYDGVDAARLSPARLASQRTLIPQEAYVFSGTVRENLSYLAPDVEAADLTRATRLLGAAPLVRRLGGAGAQVDPPALSAGERQLLALVRAYVSPAWLVILDEATCHLDPAAELRVETAFRERPGALVIVAHRMTSAARARRVLLVDGRHAAVLGTPAQLMRRSASYRELAGYWDHELPAVPRTASAPGQGRSS